MKPFLIATVALMLLGAASVGRAEVKEVYFLHRTKTKGVLKLDCDKEQKGNRPPVYTCYDNDGNGQSITPGPEWQLAELSRVCLHNTVTDTVRDCLGIAAPGKQPEFFVCQDDKGTFFRPPTEWEKLNADDGRCAPPPKKLVDLLIRGESSAALPSQIEWSEANGAQ
ncbi:MAG: hypothetical protein ACL93V_02660 [Candidatus Electrothrix sp. YB6]